MKKLLVKLQLAFMALSVITKKYYLLLIFPVVLALSSAANAAYVVYEDVGVIKDTDLYATMFTISGAGVYEATLTDFEFPVEFDSLALQLTAGNPNPLFEVGRLETPGSFTFNVAQAGDYYASIFGDAGGPYNLGLFGLQITQLSAVPLPPAVLMFFSGILFIYGFCRGNNRKKAIATTQPIIV